MKIHLRKNLLKSKFRLTKKKCRKFDLAEFRQNNETIEIADSIHVHVHTVVCPWP